MSGGAPERPGRPAPAGRGRQLALASGWLLAGLLALVVVGSSSGRVSVAGVVLVGVGVVTAAVALAGRRR